MIVVLGEALVDLVAVAPGAAAGYRALAGGGPMNTAVGLARLGSAAAFAGRLSTDAFGALLAAHLAGDGVDLGQAARTELPTTLAVVDLGPGGDAAYTFYTEGTSASDVASPFPGALADVTAVHTGSLAIALEPSATTVEAVLARERGRRLISLDPNVRPALIGDRDTYLARLDRLVAAADVVKVSVEDLAWLHPGVAAEDVASAWLDRGPALVVVTAGEHGAVGRTAAERVVVPALDVDVVDTIGAGDTFTAGLLAWLDHEDRLERAAVVSLTADDLERALAFAATAAALTCTRAGADPPRRAEVEARLG